MEKITSNKLQIMLLVSLLILTFIRFSSAAMSVDSPNKERNLETYIILLEKPEDTILMESKDLHSWYHSFLPTSILNSDQPPRLVHAYRHVVTGFSAKLTAEEAKALETREGFVLARPQRMVKVHTTHTPSFLGLERNLGFWNRSNYGKGVIIGVVDTGITPDHPSFNDEGMPPPPKRWAGKCELNGTLKCNNKLIGARNFATNSKDVLDDDGHGTHVASTAAGSPVRGASFFGQANGTAIGMAPLAHLAMYKVSGNSGAVGESEVLAAMDAAVEDGVDVLSLSLGLDSLPFYEDVIAMGAYSAIRRGIFVSASAGNDGNVSTLSNEAPWILTVGASTDDRSIRATVLLGNDVELNGESFFQPSNFSSTQLPLIYAGANGNTSSASCFPGSLKNVDVKGKIVLCKGGNESVSKGQEVKDNGGAAMIVMNDESEGFVTEANVHVLPASHVSYIAGLKIKAYINSTSSPKATILFKGTVVDGTDAPQVAEFSSRGPSIASPGILKPDIIGPGVNILAAYPVSADDTINRFAMMSGTSMSCPHLSGIAALLKSVHPNWSPAAIKSAIMTTADLNNHGDKPISDQQFVPATFFDMGAGHVNPSRANDPGLIYDTRPNDYIPYLCGLGYSDRQMRVIVKHKVNCSNVAAIPEAQLNYPSFSIRLGSTPQTYTRTVTNVGRPKSVYKLEIVAPKGVDVRVTPDRISFSRVNQKARYSITFSKNGTANGSFAQGYLKWVSDRYSVGSPIAVILE